MFYRYRIFFGIVLLVLLESVWINSMRQLTNFLGDKNSRQKETIRSSEQAIREELSCFPIPTGYRNRITYIDSYGAARENGGHEGCDIMDRENQAGTIPVVSATRGVVTNAGWLYLGGYRIGITSDSGIYYYYAHLDSYAAGIETGKEIQPGQLLGFMGNTGEGEEGTRGRFDTHLHFGIYIKDTEGNEQSVNPYPFLLEIGY
ncbi:MAG: M23 family metallopeptidase [Lachnospiraceae bacterium]|nr:M23 family metallopeptidase [Lachnospiraceae bacterium]MDE6626140.1 M23 family metallopeptidase [Lachnospiraceae bacterium]